MVSKQVMDRLERVYTHDHPLRIFATHRMHIVKDLVEHSKYGDYKSKSLENGRICERIRGLLVTKGITFTDFSKRLNEMKQTKRHRLNGIRMSVLKASVPSHFQTESSDYFRKLYLVHNPFAQ
ncbi:hypothetical protein DPMN_142026 [Dreissena polymorpha]|uniref:Uncharacterized protein n=1 Tax=Dreissena polymorpha TaxID=45954 RepID=A0A9D4GAJ1_DREPO|nr:hypothetical protein DPMN_142026 [Dreissena polymorpha]